MAKKSSLAGLLGVGLIVGLGYAAYAIFSKGPGTTTPSPPSPPSLEEIPDGVPPIFVPVPPGGYDPGPEGGVPPLPGPPEPFIPPESRQPYFHIGNKIGVGSGANYHVITITWIDTDNQIYGYLVQTAYGAEPGEMSWDAFEAAYKGLPVW